MWLCRRWRRRRRGRRGRRGRRSRDIHGARAQAEAVDGSGIAPLPKLAQPVRPGGCTTIFAVGLRLITPGRGAPPLLCLCRRRRLAKVGRRRRGKRRWRQCRGRCRGRCWSPGLAWVGRRQRRRAKHHPTFVKSGSDEFDECRRALHSLILHVLRVAIVPAPGAKELTAFLEHGAPSSIVLDRVATHTRRSRRLVFIPLTASV